MAIVFDPAIKRIILDATSVTATVLYSRSADWLATSDNAKYGAVFRQVGGDDLGDGLSIPPYFFLQGDWRVRPMETDHNLNITGNLFVEGGGVPVVRTVGPYQINVNYTVPVQAQGIATAGSSGPSASDIAEAVWTHMAAISLMGDMALLRSIEAGRWHMTGNQMIFYGEDNSTEVARFNLFDSGGQPSMTSVMQRVRV
jgi:hypothetical protein